MKKLFKKFYYATLNGYYMNDEVNTKLNVLLIYLNNIGIKSIDYESHSIKIEFNDGTLLRGWNSNRWYAWLSEGEIKFSNGEILNWNHSRPNHEIIYKFKKIVKKWEREIKKKQFQEDSDFSKYLPKGYAKRLERLKKLEAIDKSNRKNFI